MGPLGKLRSAFEKARRLPRSQQNLIVEMVEAYVDRSLPNFVIGRAQKEPGNTPGKGASFQARSSRGPSARQIRRWTSASHTAPVSMN